MEDSAPPCDTLRSLVTPDTYRGERDTVFPTSPSLQWFMRANRAELVAAGALLMPVGRWMINPAKFDAAVETIGQRRALRALEGN